MREKLKPCPFCGGKAGYYEKGGKYGKYVSLLHTAVI